LDQNSKKKLNSNFEMIIKDRISQGEGKIFDFKFKSSLFNAQNSKFPVIGFGASEGEIKYLNRIKKILDLFSPEWHSIQKNIIL
jgi:hypothetical protein